MKIAYFKNIEKLLNFAACHKIRYIFEYNKFIVVIYEITEDPKQ